MTRDTQTPVVLRRAEANDVEQVEAIERAAFSDPWTLTAFRNLLRRDEVQFDVALAPELLAPRVLGYSVLYLMGDEADLANIAVAADVQRGGVGRQLLWHAVDAARHRGVRDMWLEVRESNVAARALYAREGFAEVGRRTRYYVRPVEDALILRRTLV